MPKASTCTRVVDHEVGRDERIDRARVAAQRAPRGAHRGEVDDGRHAGEVLEDHARRQERHRHVVGGRLGPAGERAHVAPPHVDAARGAQQVLEQDPTV